MAWITPERFAQGRTFDSIWPILDSRQPQRQANAGARSDRSAVFRQAFEAARLTADQRRRWLADGSAGRAGEDARAVRRLVV